MVAFFKALAKIGRQASTDFHSEVPGYTADPTKAYFTQLPDDCIVEIICLLDCVEDLIALRLTCRRLSELTLEHAAWLYRLHHFQHKHRLPPFPPSVFQAPAAELEALVTAEHRFVQSLSFVPNPNKPGKRPKPSPPATPPVLTAPTTPSPSALSLTSESTTADFFNRKPSLHKKRSASSSHLQLPSTTHHSKAEAQSALPRVTSYIDTSRAYTSSPSAPPLFAKYSSKSSTPDRAPETEHRISLHAFPAEHLRAALFLPPGWLLTTSEISMLPPGFEAMRDGEGNPNGDKKDVGGVVYLWKTGWRGTAERLGVGAAGPSARFVLDGYGIEEVRAERVRGAGNGLWFNVLVCNAKRNRCALLRLELPADESGVPTFKLLDTLRVHKGVLDISMYGDFVAFLQDKHVMMWNWSHSMWLNVVPKGYDDETTKYPTGQARILLQPPFLYIVSGAHAHVIASNIPSRRHFVPVTASGHVETRRVVTSATYTLPKHRAGDMQIYAVHAPSGSTPGRGASPRCEPVADEATAKDGKDKVGKKDAKKSPKTIRLPFANVDVLPATDDGSPQVTVEPPGARAVPNHVEIEVFYPKFMRVIRWGLRHLSPDEKAEKLRKEGEKGGADAYADADGAGEEEEPSGSGLAGAVMAAAVGKKHHRKPLFKMRVMQSTYVMNGLAGMSGSAGILTPTETDNLLEKLRAAKVFPPASLADGELANMLICSTGITNQLEFYRLLHEVRSLPAHARRRMALDPVVGRVCFLDEDCMRLVDFC